MNSQFKQKNQLYWQYLEFTVNIALYTVEHLKIKYSTNKNKMHKKKKMSTDGK